MIEFKDWGKTPRLNRDIIVTEKIDGTNAAVIIEQVESFNDGEHVVCTRQGNFAVGAQSRNRLVTPGKATDHFGFAGWVREHAEALVHILGAGHHFGEWWGQGIARKYGLDHKRFSLFNADRGAQLIDLGRQDGWVAHGLDTVPILYRGRFSQQAIDGAVEELRFTGSKVAAEGWAGKAEGVCVFHTASRQVYKVLLENDELPKSLLEAAA